MGACVCKNHTVERGIYLATPHLCGLVNSEISKKAPQNRRFLPLQSLKNQAKEKALKIQKKAEIFAEICGIILGVYL